MITSLFTFVDRISISRSGIFAALSYCYFQLKIPVLIEKFPSFLINLVILIMAVSFKFATSSKAKELGKGAIVDESSTKKPNDAEPDFVTSVSKHKIVSTKLEEPKKEAVVIPCQKDGFKIALEQAFSDKDVEAAAIAALNKDAHEYVDGKEETITTETFVIPAQKQTDEVDEGDLDKIAKQVTIGEAADYGAVNIDDFGMAMLRGMGFKEGEGIGKTNKVSVKPIEPHVRPKGQGLGAGVNRKKQMTAKSNTNNDASDEEVEIDLKTGVRCMITAGQHNEKYATVEGTDAENSRVFLRLAIGNKVLSLPEASVKAVGEKEFQKYSKYLSMLEY